MFNQDTNLKQFKMAKKVSNSRIPLTQHQHKSKVEDIWHFPEVRIGKENMDCSNENSTVLQDKQPANAQDSKKVKIVISQSI